MMGWVLESALRAEYRITFPWWVFLMLGGTFTFWATYRRIEVSAAALTVLGLMEMGIVVFLAGWGLITPGPGGVSLASFNPAHAPSGNGLYLGIIFSLFAMTGWEGVVPLAEESQNPRHVVSRAIVYTILIMGAYLVFTSWGIVIGWGMEDLGAMVASKELPPFALARRFWGAGWIVIMFALLNSMLAVAVACSLVSTRMWYTMARCGALPSSLAAVHSRHEIPINAVVLQAVVTSVGGLALGFWLGPDQAFYVMGTVLTLALASDLQRRKPRGISPLPTAWSGIPPGPARLLSPGFDGCSVLGGLELDRTATAAAALLCPRDHGPLAACRRGRSDHIQEPRPGPVVARGRICREEG